MRRISRLATAIPFFVGVILIGIIPFPLLYVFSNLTQFFLYKVFRYRRKIIESNLANAYPNLQKSEKRKLVYSIYRNISDILLEGLKSFLITNKQVIKRHSVLNPEIIDSYLQSGKSILGLTAHYANWEWGSLSASGQIKAKVVAFYKKLSNPIIDGFIRKNRMKFGTTLAPITKTAKTFEKHIDEITVFVMAADQNTIRRNLSISYWIKFFGREIPFLHGPEKYARLYNIPVFYIDIQRVRCGFYEIEISLLTDDPSKLQEGELTELYAQKLESVIRKKPEDWLWSHKRWKFAR